jgi:hypothetical protein
MKEGQDRQFNIQCCAHWCRVWPRGIISLMHEPRVRIVNEKASRVSFRWCVSIAMNEDVPWDNVAMYYLVLQIQRLQFYQRGQLQVGNTWQLIP